jgi:hypothetical protein
MAAFEAAETAVYVLKVHTLQSKKSGHPIDLMPFLGLPRL